MSSGRPASVCTGATASRPRVFRPAGECVQRPRPPGHRAPGVRSAPPSDAETLRGGGGPSGPLRLNARGRNPKAACLGERMTAHWGQLEAERGPNCPLWTQTPSPTVLSPFPCICLSSFQKLRSHSRHCLNDFITRTSRCSALHTTQGSKGSPARRLTSSQQALGSGSRCWRGPCCRSYFLLLAAASSAEKSQESWNKGLWPLVGAGHWSLVLLPPLLQSHREAGTTDSTIQTLKHLGAGHQVHPLLTLEVSLGRSGEGPRVTGPAHGPGHQDTQQVCWKTEPRSPGQAVLPTLTLPPDSSTWSHLQGTIQGTGHTAHEACTATPGVEPKL